MKALILVGAVITAFSAQGAVACDREAGLGGRFSPFYAMAHNAGAPQQPEGPFQSEPVRSSMAFQGLIAKERDASAADTEKQEQPAQSSDNVETSVPAEVAKSESDTVVSDSPSEKVTA
jgi:hypothetical protein